MKRRTLETTNYGLLLVGTICVLMLSMLAREAVAASFNCAKAKSATEQTVCRNAVLSKLDEELARVFDRALMQSPNAQPIRNTQRNWLQLREGCKSDPHCIAQRYDERIRQLRYGSNKNGVPEMTPIFGEEEKVCERYGQFLAETSSGIDSRSPRDEEKWMCSRLIPSELGDFAQPIWREVNPKQLMDLLVEIHERLDGGWEQGTASMAGPGGEKYRDAIRQSMIENYNNGHFRWYEAEADIDNDGKPERLIKFRRGRCGPDWPESVRYSIPLLVLNEKADGLDLVKSRQLLQAPMGGKFSAEMESFDVFSFAGKTYIDQWKNNPYDSKMNQPTAKTLSIFLHQGSSAALVCRFVSFPK